MLAPWPVSKRVGRNKWTTGYDVNNDPTYTKQSGAVTNQKSGGQKVKMTDLPGGQIHSVSCFDEVVWKVHGYRSLNFEKSLIFNLRFQKVSLQCRIYLKLTFQGINSPLDPSGGQKIQCFIK